MPNRFSVAAKMARDATNKELATEISAVCNINRDKLNELMPAKRDKEVFVNLMQQVEADTSMDVKLAYLQANIKTAGKVALDLLKAFV